MKRHLILSAALLLFLSCHKDTETIVDIVDKPTPPKIIITTQLVSLRDTITDTDGASLVTFDELTLPGGDFPFQAFRGQQIQRDYETASYTTTKGITFLQSPVLIENDVNYMHWKLPTMSEMQASAGNAVSIQLSADTKLDIPAQSLLTTAGQPYSGSYTLYYSVIPAQDSQSASIPSFQGINAQSEIQHLIFSECFLLYAISQGGEILHFNQQTYLQSLHAPSVTGWHFDQETGIWQQLPSSSDQIPVSASGYYCKAASATPVRLTGQYLMNDLPAPHQPLNIFYRDQQQTIYTTNAGKWAVYVPANESIRIETTAGCQVPFTTTVETGAQETMQYDVKVSSPQIINAVIEGIARDCDAAPLTNHFLQINGHPIGFVFSPLADFTFHIPVCQGESVQLTGIDTETNETGPTITWQTDDSIQVHSVFACEKAQREYLSLTVSGESKMYWDLKSAFTGQSRIAIEEGADEDDLELGIFITGMMEGSYENTMLNILFEDQHLGTKGYSLYCPTSTTGCGFTQFTITHFPAQQGAWIKGYFEGSFWIKTFTPLTAGYRPVKGEFQVYREF